MTLILTWIESLHQTRGGTPRACRRGSRIPFRSHGSRQPTARRAVTGAPAASPHPVPSRFNKTHLSSNATNHKVQLKRHINEEQQVLKHALIEAGNERAIWVDVVTEIEKRVDSRAEAEWTTPELIRVGALNYEPPGPINISMRGVTINEAALAKKFFAATGPSDAAGQVTNGNPYWPNSTQTWAGEFVPRLASAVTEALNAVAGGAEIGPVDLESPLEALGKAVSAHVDQTLTAVSGATAGLQRRTNLLWWKETLFSPSVHLSYRAMPPSIAAAMMAFDLHKLVPTLSPASVAAFLHETVLNLSSFDPNASRPLRDHLTDATSSEWLAPLQQAAVELVPEPTGRGPLLGLIGHRVGRPQLDDRAFRTMVGVPAATALTTPEWANWIFRELQAARAAQEVTVAKRPRRARGSR